MVVVVAAGALVWHTNADHQRDRHAAMASRAEAGRACVDAVVAGEQAFAAGTVAVATLAGTVVDAAEGTGLARVDRGVAAVTTAQDPARPALAACATDTDAPAECVHSAEVLTDAAARQEQQAVTLREIAVASRARDQAAVDAGLTLLTRQRTELEQVVASVEDLLCAQAAGIREGPSLPEVSQ